MKVKVLISIAAAAIALQSCGSSTGPLAQGTYDVLGIINVGPAHYAAHDTVSLSAFGVELPSIPLDEHGHASRKFDPGSYRAQLIVGGQAVAYDSNVVIRSNATTYDTLVVCPQCVSIKGVSRSEP